MDYHINSLNITFDKIITGKCKLHDKFGFTELPINRDWLSGFM